MALKLIPFPELYLIWCPRRTFPHVSCWKWRGLTGKTIVEGLIAWKVTDDWFIFGSHESAFLQPESELIREKCFVSQPVLVDFTLFHVYIAKLDSTGRECHFNANLTNITWVWARQPGSRSVDFLAQWIQPARFPVEMGGNEHTELTSSNQLGIQSAQAGEKKAMCNTLRLTSPVPSSWNLI